ncbi:MAG: hypothetical protein MI717_13885 [Spirochaetales bacterium]|nr:hypothetical protein [Spirochaetales bacterium]
MTKESTVAMHIINDEELGPLILPELRDFISLSAAMERLSPPDVGRYLIGRLLLESSKCEELLDEFGAHRNLHWAPFRMSVAVAKAFSRVCYNLFHIHHSAEGYKLLPVEGDFIQATQDTLHTLLASFSTASAAFMSVARAMDLAKELTPVEEYGFRDVKCCGRLAEDRMRQEAKNPGDTAVYLATSLLNLAEESSWLDIYRKTPPEEYSSCIPDVVSEARLRYLANNFHSLQSLYDTYLRGSDIAERDENLPVMRGQITVVFHLLDTAETLVHYYERHSLRKWDQSHQPSVDTQTLINIILGYFIAFADKYIIAATELCRDVLKSYAVQGEIEVPIPNYRGFHVRPSTLIAKIAIHYGSDVKMLLGSTVYDASLPLELFRANEELNRRKRDAVARYVMEHKLVKNDAGSSYDEPLMKKILRVIFLDLLEKQKVMIYDNDFSFDDLSPYENETLAEFIKRAIALYLAMGKIDIVSGDMVSFQGDMRVLEDIRTLAENGYGEDKFGNNIVLPSSLSYLKR